MNLLDLIPGLTQIIDRVIPNPQQKQQLEFELKKVQAEEVKARMGVLKGMLSNKSMFVAGAIPALIWLAVLGIFNNYVIGPWFGNPPINYPEQYWSLLTIVITGLFGKKLVDGNEIRWPNGNVMTPKKDAPPQVATQKVADTPPVEKKKLTPEEIDERIKNFAKELDK